MKTIIPSTRGSIKKTKNKTDFRYARFKAAKKKKNSWARK